MRETGIRIGVVLACTALAATAVGQNPNSGPTTTGQELSVEIFADDIVFESATSALVSAGATLGEPASFQVNVCFVVDVSGSMENPVFNQPTDIIPPPGIGPEDDANGDGARGMTIDAAIFGILALNENLGTGANIDICIIPFGAESFASDMRPAPGIQPWAASPIVDLSGNGVPDVEDVARSLDAVPLHGTDFFRFQSAGNGTNYDAALEQVNLAFAGQPAGELNIAFFLSDGTPTDGQFSVGVGSPLQEAAANGIRIHTLGLGAIAPTLCDPGGPLNLIAIATDATCTEVLDPSNLTTALPDAAATELVELKLSVNGNEVTSVLGPDANALSIVDFDVYPNLMPGLNVYEATATAADGTVISATDMVTVSMCMLFVSLDRPTFRWRRDAPLVSNAHFSTPITLNNVPTLQVPSNPSFNGMHVQMQVIMYNPIDFPWNPLQSSNCIDVVIGGTSTPYGGRDGMSLWTSGPVPLGGQIVPQFLIGNF